MACLARHGSSLVFIISKNSGVILMKLVNPGMSVAKVGVLRPVQQPGSYWDRSSELPLVGLEPTEVTGMSVAYS